MVGNTAEMSQKLTNMPNFRRVEIGQNTNESMKFSPAVYRSSRPDYLTQDEANYFVNTVGIKCIIDIRSPSEYKKAKGSKLIDHYFPLYQVKLPFSLKYKESDHVYCKEIKNKKLIVSKENSKMDQDMVPNGSTTTEDHVQDVYQRKHFLIDFFKRNYIWAIYSSAPWYIQLYSILFLILDLILRTGFIHFVRVFARNVLNKKGITGQYKDILTYSQAAICAALKIMTNTDNFPMMVNCAHGKDRTGLICALVQGCLGVPSEKIAQDYAQSESELAPIKDRVWKEIVDKFHMDPSFTNTKAETMIQTLEFIEKEYGSITGYLNAIGFGSEDQKKLKKIFGQT